MANYKRKPAPRKATKKSSSFQKWLNQNTSKLTISLIAIIAVVMIALIVMISVTLSYDKVYDGIKPLTGEDIADVVYYAASAPAHVQIAEVLVLPVHQASGTVVHRS